MTSSAALPSFKSTSATTIDCAADRIDLVAWLTTLTDRDYQDCSRAHRAAGTFHEGPTLGMVNVENVGGNLMVQHYLMATGSPSRVVMYSRDSRAYLGHLIPATVEVIWTVQVEPLTAQSTTFRCTVETRLPPALYVVAKLAMLPVFIARHTRDETVGFARDIARKVLTAGSTARALMESSVA